MRTDIYTELYLLNKNIDSLIRVVQHLELLGIGPSGSRRRSSLPATCSCECAVGMLRKPTKYALFTLFAFVA